MAINKKFKRFNGTSWEEYYFYAYDSAKLGSQSPSYYRNASNLNAGTISSARLPYAGSAQKGAIRTSYSNGVLTISNTD